MIVTNLFPCSRSPFAVGRHMPRFRLSAGSVLRVTVRSVRRPLLAMLCVASLALAGRLVTVAGERPDASAPPTLRGALAYISAGNVWLQRGAAPPHQLTATGAASFVRWSPAGSTLMVTEARQPR